MGFTNRLGVRDEKNRGVRRTNFFLFPLSIWKYSIPIFREGKVSESSIFGAGVEDQTFGFGSVKFEIAM